MSVSMQSNAPMRVSGSTSVFQNWINALTKPSEQTFANMVAEPGASAGKAYLWVFVTTLVNFFFTFLVSGFSMMQALRQFNDGGNFGSGAGGGLLLAVLGSPIAAAISVLFFAIGAAIIQWIAKLFGGRGTTGQLAYALGAVLAPFYLINVVLTLLGAIPLVGFCFGIVGALVGIYVFVLEIIAVKGVNQFGWGAAIGSVLIPGLVIGLLIACIFGLMIFALGPSIGNTFSSINQGLAP